MMYNDLMVLAHILCRILTVFRRKCFDEDLCGSRVGAKKKNMFLWCLSFFLVEFYVDMLGSRFCPLDSLYLEHI